MTVNMNLILRSQIIRAIRSFFELRGFLEVDTPFRIPANAPEEHIEPVRSGDHFMHTSPELCMKRLLCRGHEKIFQICKCWRSGERGSKHVPEFTLLEWYRTDSTYKDLMHDCEDLLRYIASVCFGCVSVSYNSLPISLIESFTTITVRDAFRKWSNVSMEDAVNNGSFDEIMVTFIEPALKQNKPVLLIDYPIEMAALARPKQTDTSVAERFELYAGGMELANGFSELNDPKIQRERFMEANRKRAENGYEELPIPQPFLEELSQLPPSAGIALGVDRLVMLFSGASNIDDVMAFPPESL